MTKEEAKSKIKEIVGRTSLLIPLVYEQDLPPSVWFADVPDWHNYEYTIWNNGEQIRKILCEHKSLRKDSDLLDLFLTVALNRNAKRGRQSFIMLFGYKHCAEYADLLAAQLDDDFVGGHIIEVLYKMKAGQFVSVVKPYTMDKIAWIRNQAKKYMNRYGGCQGED